MQTWLRLSPFRVVFDFIQDDDAKGDYPSRPSMKAFLFPSWNFSAKSLFKATVHWSTVKSKCLLSLPSIATFRAFTFSSLETSMSAGNRWKCTGGQELCVIQKLQK